MMSALTKSSDTLRPEDVRVTRRVVRWATSRGAAFGVLCTTYVCEGEMSGVVATATRAGAGFMVNFGLLAGTIVATLGVTTGVLGATLEVATSAFGACADATSFEFI